MQRLFLWGLRRYIGGPGRSWVFSSLAVLGFRAAKSVVGRRELIDVGDIKSGQKIVIESLPISHKKQIRALKADDKATKKAGKATKKAGKATKKAGKASKKEAKEAKSAQRKAVRSARPSKASNTVKARPAKTSKPAGRRAAKDAGRRRFGKAARTDVKAAQT